MEAVIPGSTAEKAGLKYGDFLVELNGNDIQSFSKEAVIAAIKASNRGALSIRVARVRPIPMTAEDRKTAVRMVKNKVRSEGREGDRGGGGKGGGERERGGGDVDGVSQAHLCVAVSSESELTPSPVCFDVCVGYEQRQQKLQRE